MLGADNYNTNMAVVLRIRQAQVAALNGTSLIVEHGESPIYNVDDQIISFSDDG